MTEGFSFSKWQGLGNDFVVVEGPPPAPQVAAELAQKICHRRLGVGADGLVFLTDGPGMVIYNADGSLAMMCGNALRCLGALLCRNGFSAVGQEVTLSTSSGPRSARVLRDAPWWVEVNMGRPDLILQPASFLFRGQELTIHLASMGNPHAVILEPPADRESWEECGRLMQSAPFAERDGINVEFVTVEAGGLDVWVYERGVGPTRACGTGACAAFAVAWQLELCSPQGVVRLPGGDLELEWSDPPLGNLKMRGPAQEVYRGQWTANQSQP